MLLRFAPRNDNRAADRRKIRGPAEHLIPLRAHSSKRMIYNGVGIAFL
jgi:hypothetical protein